jgi:DNA polymerase I-like protein with 3'-5' exonuclease and polymerase domains
MRLGPLPTSTDPDQSLRRRLLPADLLDVPKNIEFSVDTETSGLHPDSGARVSTVSVAFLDDGSLFSVPMEPGTEEWPSGIVEVGEWFELDGNNVRIISIAWPFDQGVDDTGKPEDTGMVGLWKDTENLGSSEWSDLMSALTDRPLIMHNAKFDLMMIKAGVRWMPGLGIDLHRGVVWDTMVGCSLLWPRFNNALKGPGSWSYNEWGAESAEEQKVIKEYLRRQKLPSGRWDLMPWSIIAKYAMGDATLTLRLQIEQKRLLDRKPDQLALFERRMDVMRMLYRVEQRGMPFDVKASRQAAEVLKSRIEENKRKLPFSPATLPAAKKYWFSLEDGGLGLTPYEETEKGAPAVNETVLARMIEDKIPGAKEWGEVQKGQTADSRWYSGYPDLCGPDGRLRGSLRQFGTVSHRFSIERVQLQAIPQDYRLNRAILKGLPSPRHFIRTGVPAGTKLWDLDLANAELRIAALYADANSMLDLIKTGQDVHTVTAQELFGTSPGDPTWERDRMVGKRGNFSLIFDVGWETFQEMVYKQADIRLSEEESRRIVREWKALYPEFKRAVDRHSRKVDERRRRNKDLGWVQVWNGERRWYGKDRDPKKRGELEDTHSAFNQRVQTALGQFAIEWWLAVEREGMERFGGPGGLGLVMMVHDSADILVPDNAQGEAFIEWCQEEGVRIWDRVFPGVPGGVDAKEFGT